MDSTGSVAEVRAQLIETAGRIAHEFGFGRVAGQVLVALYLSRSVMSLDELVAELELSKAAVSTSAKQLETLGLLQRIWRKGDRRCYYRTVDNITSALQQGLLVFIGQKAQQAAVALDGAADELSALSQSDEDATFLLSRVRRARDLEGYATKFLGLLFAGDTP